MKLGKPYFRVGIAAVLHNKHNEVTCFARTDKPEIWQFPQGGVDKTESFEDALWREIYEETAVTAAMIDVVTPYPNWTLYEYPEALKNETKDVLGQVHRWYFLKLKDDCQPDLDKAVDKEFSAWQTISMTDFLALPNHDFKLPVYNQLSDFYQKHVL